MDPSHWDQVYATKAEAEVSWFEESPDISLQLIDAAKISLAGAVVDIGGGTSKLVDALVARGQAHVTVVELSSTALALVAKRLGLNPRVDFIATDVCRWQPDRRYELWHDRAALHFLTQPAEQAAYVVVLRRALQRGGAAIIGTFAPDGPERCSGLPVTRHDEETLASMLGSGFAIESTRRHTHRTPWGTEQRFQFSTFRRL